MVQTVEIFYNIDQSVGRRSMCGDEAGQISRDLQINAGDPKIGENAQPGLQKVTHRPVSSYPCAEKHRIVCASRSPCENPFTRDFTN